MYDKRIIEGDKIENKEVVGIYEFTDCSNMYTLRSMLEKINRWRKVKVFVVHLEKKGGG